MTVLPIIKYPNPLLKEKSVAVEKVDVQLQKFLDDMLETMYAEHGVGLAAVQVGVLKRILVMDVEYELEKCDGHHDHTAGHDHIINKQPIFMINPKITQASFETSVLFEGCLSFPEIRADVERPREVTVEYLDYHGKASVIHASGLLATCVQHEIDHLNGVTFPDHLSKIKREVLLKKFLKKKNNKNS